MYYCKKREWLEEIEVEIGCSRGAMITHLVSMLLPSVTLESSCA